MAAGISEDAVVRRLAPMCVARFKQDVKKDQKLKSLDETGSYEQADYVKNQGWATLPGELKPDPRSPMSVSSSSCRSASRPS
jgi:hypothetical protein